MKSLVFGVINETHKNAHDSWYRLLVGRREEERSVGLEEEGGRLITFFYFGGRALGGVGV